MGKGVERAVNVTLGITANALGEMAHARVLVDEGFVSGHKQFRLDPLEDGSDVLAGEEVVLGEDGAGAGDGAVLAGINAGHITVNAGDPLVTTTSLGSVLSYADGPKRLLAGAGVDVDGLDGDGDGRVRNYTDEARLSNFAARVRRVHADERLLDTEIGGSSGGGDLYVPSHNLKAHNLVGGRSKSAVDNPVTDHEGGHDEGVGCLAVGRWGQLNSKDIYGGDHLQNPSRSSRPRKQRSIRRRTESVVRRPRDTHGKSRVGANTRALVVRHHEWVRIASGKHGVWVVDADDGAVANFHGAVKVDLLNVALIPLHGELADDDLGGEGVAVDHISGDLLIQSRQSSSSVSPCDCTCCNMRWVWALGGGGAYIDFKPEYSRLVGNKLSPGNESSGERNEHILGDVDGPSVDGNGSASIV